MTARQRQRFLWAVSMLWIRYLVTVMLAALEMPGGTFIHRLLIPEPGVIDSMAWYHS
jgi:hypothetical protein